MLSTRGRAYAQSGLMDGYAREHKEPYNKSTNLEGEVNFLQAENFAMHEVVRQYIQINNLHLTYNEGPIGTLRLRAAMAVHLNHYLSPFTSISTEHITFTAGVTGLNEMIALSLTNDGDGILLGRPIYGSFYGDLTTRTNSKLVYTTMGNIDQFSTDAVKNYEYALLQAKLEGVNVKALIICNPHNPLGRCYSVDALKALMRFCEKYKIHLVSDEIYALSAFEIPGEGATPYTSVLSIDPNELVNPGRLHVLYGMSKDFGAAGLRLGCLISQNRELTTAIRAIGRFNWPSEVSCAIATTILEDRAFVAAYTKKSRRILSEQYVLVTKILGEAGIGYSRYGHAGFFVWMDLSPWLAVNTPDSQGWAAEKELKGKLSQAGVEMSSGLGYKAETPGWFRLLYTLDRESLVEGLRRIVEITKIE